VAVANISELPTLRPAPGELPSASAEAPALVLDARS
jgi:hypothetical protein